MPRNESSGSRWRRSRRNRHGGSSHHPKLRAEAETRQWPTTRPYSRVYPPSVVPAASRVAVANASPRLRARSRNVDVAGRSAAGGVGRLNLTLASLLSQATQTHPAVGQLTQVVGSLAIGSGLMLGVLGGLAALGLAYRDLTKDARDSKDAQDEVFERLRRLQEQQRIADLGPGGQSIEDEQTARAEVGRLQDEIAEQKKLIEQLESFEALGAGREGAVEAGQRRLQELQSQLTKTFGIVESVERDVTEEVAKYEEERTEIARREAEERASIAEREAAERTRIVDQEQREAEQAAEAQERILEQAAAYFAGIRREREADIQSSENRIASMAVAIDQQERLIVALGQGTDAENELRVAIAGENAARELAGKATRQQIIRARDLAEQNVRLAITIKEIAEAERELKRAVAAEEKAERERTRAVRDNIRDAQEYADSVIQVANAFGFLDDEAARALESAVQIGAAIARIAILKDPTAIPSLIGGIASLFSGGPSQAEIEAERLQTENNRILERNNRSLERLRDQLPSAGLTGAEAQATIDAINTARAIRQPPRDEGGFTVGGGFTPFGRGFGDRGFTPTGGGTAPISFVDALETAGLSMEELGRIARQLGVEIFDAAGNLDLTALEEAAETWIKVQKQIEAALVQDLGVRRLRALGMDKEAEALRLQIQQERELADARARGFSAETIAALKSVQALEKLAAARQDELAAIQALRDFQNSLRLGPLSTLSPSAQLDEARRQFEETRSAASVGDAEAAADLPAAARAFLEASRAFNASGPQFAADFKLVNDTITSLTDMFGEQQSINAKIAEETKINGSTLRESLTEHKATVRVLSAGLTQVVEELQSLREEQRDQVRHRREVIEEAA